MSSDMQPNTRIVFVGAVRSSQAALEELVAAGLPPQVVVTLPEKDASRHSDYHDLRPLCRNAGIEVVETDTSSDDFRALLLKVRPHFLFVIGWSRMINDDCLGIPVHGSIGYHPALLPAFRGRAVIPWTILMELEQTGSTLFWMNREVDAGDILLQESIPVSPDESAGTLYEKHLAALRKMTRNLVNMLASAPPEHLPRVPQDHAAASYCARRTDDDGFIDWSRPALEIWKLIRAAAPPYPGAFTLHRDLRLRVLDASPVGRLNYIGLPGQVQALSAEGAVVTCGDGHHLLLHDVRIESRDGERPQFRLHEKLEGIRPDAVRKRGGES